MIKLRPDILVLIFTLHTHMYAHTYYNFLSSFSLCKWNINFSFPKVCDKFPLSSSPTQVSFSFVSKPRQKYWLWEIFIGCHLDKYKNLIEYSPQLLVETKHGVAMDTGCLASALTHQSLFSSTMCKPQMLPCIVFIISLDLFTKEYLGFAVAEKDLNPQKENRMSCALHCAFRIGSNLFTHHFYLKVSASLNLNKLLLS